MKKALFEPAFNLLCQLIATPSFSREEDATALLIADFLQKNGIACQRTGNNVWAQNRHFSAHLPTLLLNSHHDTVRPNAGYTRPPFEPVVENGRLYGLGSNDAGGCLVSLLAAFVYFYEKKDLPVNLVMAATAEEEISGKNGMEALFPCLPVIDCALVGEPTGGQLAIAEKGLLVLDVWVEGRSGHAAREEGINALYQALPDIDWFRTYRFERLSPWLGAVKMSVTSIETPNKAHNVVPDRCHFIVDIRLTDAYTPEQILETVRNAVGGTVQPRSLRLRASAIVPEHPLVQAGRQMGRQMYGSPTLSDKALLPVPALKMGPGDSARSHAPDEYLTLEELQNGIDDYIQLIQNTAWAELPRRATNLSA